MTTYVTVCKNTILANLKRGTKKPPIRVSEGKYGKPRYFHQFAAEGNVRVVADMENPLPWGARVWLEVDQSKQEASTRR